jgi:hypothetical protein
MNALAVLETYTAKQVDNAREAFRKRFDLWYDGEKKLCKKHKRPSLMTDEKAREILSVLENHCPDAWHIVALEKLVFGWNLVPDAPLVDEYAVAIRAEALGIPVSTPPSSPIILPGSGANA